MKKINALGLLAVGLGAIATAGAPISVSSPAPISQHQQSTSHRDMKRDEKSEIKEIIRAQARGSLSMYMIKEGIPPHIYGQYHVRRGTHKKTNKK